MALNLFLIAVFKSSSIPVRLVFNKLNKSDTKSLIKVFTWSCWAVVKVETSNPPKRTGTVIAASVAILSNKEIQRATIRLEGEYLRHCHLICNDLN